MKNNLNLLLSDKIIKLSIFASVALIIIESFLVLFFYTSLPPLVPFFNSRPWGEARLSQSVVFLSVPIILVIIFLVNNILSGAIYKKNVLIARILSFNALLFVGLCLIAVFQIMFLIY